MKKIVILLSVVFLASCGPKSSPMMQISPLQDVSKKSFAYIPLKKASKGEVQRISRDTYMVAYPKKGDPVMYRVFSYAYSRQAELCRKMKYAFVKGIKKPISFNDKALKADRTRIHTYAKCAHKKLDKSYFSVLDRDLTYKAAIN